MYIIISSQYQMYTFRFYKLLPFFVEEGKREKKKDVLGLLIFSSVEYYCTEEERMNEA